MPAVSVVAYAYEADMHCTHCASARFSVGPHTGHLVAQHSPIKHIGMPTVPRNGWYVAKDWEWVPLDEQGIPADTTDRDCDLVHAVFSTDECELVACGTCRVTI